MRRRILPLLIISLFLLTACTSKEAPVTTQGNAFIGGTVGITAEFEPISVIEEDRYSIFDTEGFPLSIVLKNKGEQNILAGQVRAKLLGPSQEDFINIPNWNLVNEDEIEKISEFNPEGGEEIITFTPGEDARYTADVTGVTDLNWNVEYDYDYQTHLIINDVCFKGDVTDKKICTLKEGKVFSVSGAPISVTAVEEDTAGRGLIVLKITIENKGSGSSTVIGNEFDNRFDQISYTIDEPEKWECKSGGRENEARLTEGKATILCKIRAALAENDLYTKNIRMELNYAYKELVQEKLRIKESAE
jgi:hypothetical protein